MSETTTTNTLQAKLIETHKLLQSSLEKNAGALPKDLNRTRFLQNCLAVVREFDPAAISKFEPQSISATLIKGAFLGLDFFNKECYAIPYGNQLNFQTDYKGEVKLVKKYATEPVRDVYAKIIRDGDEFEEGVDTNGNPYVMFRAKPLNDGAPLGAFAVAILNNGGIKYETMSKKEIESVRDNYSKQATGPAWSKSPLEMWKKTVIRRLCKNIDLDFDSPEQRNLWEEGSGVEFEIINKEPRVIDVTPTE